MRIRIDIDTLSTVRVRGILAALNEREQAHIKHGDNSIENVHDDATMLTILVEEVGEVARAMTYDQNISELRKEIAQVMAVAWAWHDQLVP